VRIKQVHIQGFRCLRDVAIDFDKISTFIGPNGAGKSSVLRALDWFFNADPKKSVLGEDDVYSGALEKKISVRVEFDNLTEADRDKLGKYTPPSVDTLTVWRFWENGTEKITGKAMAFSPFEQVRAGETATERKARYLSILGENPGNDFPAWTNDARTLSEMDNWEREHPEQLEVSQISGTHFFGFAGQGILSGLFDFVLVTADLRASEESQDSKSSVVGRILEKTVNRTTADAALRALAADLTQRHSEIVSEHFGPQLEELSRLLTAEISSFSTGRTVAVKPQDSEYQPQASKFRVRVNDNGNETGVDRQGHGFQRSLLISALKLLAQKGASGADGSVICLAIEEPELFQHPSQGRAFATVLRKLAEDSTSGIQVAYATHSPYFIEPRYFNQLRRVTRYLNAETSHMDVRVSRASTDEVCVRLAGYMEDESVRRQLDNACIRSLEEALFADGVVLVEGPGDRGVIEGVAERTHPLSISSIVVAAIGGKCNFFLPVAILEKLNIPFYVVFDGDKAIRSRMVGQSESKMNEAEVNTNAVNRKLLEFLGYPAVDWPNQVAGEYTAFEDDFEGYLQSQWPEWESKRQDVIARGLGFSGKNSATYRLSAIDAGSNPPQGLLDIADKGRALAR
jgi:putative ATP-dependent endonuclease of OLD family